MSRMSAKVEVTRPPSSVVPCRLVHLVYVCERMRADEIEQYAALCGPFDPERAAIAFARAPGHKFTVLGPDGFPAACGGYEEVFPGVWQSWMAGTPAGWTTSWRAITKGSRWLADGLLELGARRLQTNALASRTEAIEWYERGLGLKREGTWRSYGANGEDVACFARVREADHG